MTNILIAEIGSVHDGSLNALNLIHLAKECGANAVKFQYHISKAETSAKAPSHIILILKQDGITLTEYHFLKINGALYIKRQKE